MICLHGGPKFEVTPLNNIIDYKHFCRQKYNYVYLCYTVK